MYDLCVRFLTSAANLAVGGGDGLVYTSRQEVVGVADDHRDAELGWVSRSNAYGLDVGDVWG